MENVGFRDDAIFLVPEDVFQHVTIVRHLGFCPAGCHDSFAIGKPAHIGKRERVHGDRKEMSI